MTTVLLARHGEPDWESAGPERDPGLTEVGREQSRQLGEWLAVHGPVDALYSSTLRRARETAELVAPCLALPYDARDEFREWPEPGGVHPALPGPGAPFELAPDGGASEAYRAFSETIWRGFQSVTEAQWDRTLLIICHGGVIGTLLRTLLGGHRATLRSSLTGLTRLDWKERLWQIAYFNRCDHLFGADTDEKGAARVNAVAVR